MRNSPVIGKVMERKVRKRFSRTYNWKAGQACSVISPLCGVGGGRCPVNILVS